MKLTFFSTVVSLVVIVGVHCLDNERPDVVSKLSSRAQQPLWPNLEDSNSNLFPWSKRNIADMDETCIDKASNCRRANSKCWRNPGYYLDFCKRTCRACDLGCVNDHRNCGTWVKKGYCKKEFHYSEYVLTVCKQACNVCVPSSGTTEYYAVERGNLYSLNFKIFIIKTGLGPVSPFHDIPLFANEVNKIFNMVVEIPRWTNAKMEIDTKDDLNAIKQDTKNDELRYIANCFPYKGYIWNYGALPQTWEDPNRIDASTGQKGDNDPIDVCEIGYRVAKRGEVLQVKVLGVLALIDEGETDWKLIVIDINDPLAPQLNDINDLEEHMPGFIDATVDWFTIYKVPSGKPENQFAFNGEPKNREFAHQIILETHEYWKDLIEGRSDSGGLSTKSVTVTNAVSKITVTEAKAIRDVAHQPGPPLPLDPEVDNLHYCR